MNKINNDDVLVLFSGGQDSTTCLYWAKRKFRNVYALSFIYGQKHQKEVEVAKKIANKASVKLEIMAQGGLSVAGGCRCLTKELDMIAC